MTRSVKAPPPHTLPARRRADIALLCTAVFWGLSFPLGKALALVHEHLAPAESQWFVTTSTIWPRFVIGTLLVLMFSGRALRGITRSERIQGVGLALFLSCGLFLQVDGLRHTEASTSAFLSQAYIVLLPLWVFWRRRRWPPLRVLGSTALIVAGVAILADVDWSRLHLGRGEWETIVSTFFFAGQILWLERPAFRGNRPMPVTALMFVTTALIFFIAASSTASGVDALLAPFHSVPWVTFTVVIAIVCTFGAFTLMNTYQPMLPATEAGVIYATEPLWASFMALFLPALFSSFAGFDYMNESITSRLLIGGALITAANLVIHLRPPAARPTIVPPGENSA